MNLRKRILIGVLFGFIMLGKGEYDVHAIKYEEKWKFSVGTLNTQVVDLIKTSDGGTLGFGICFDSLENNDYNSIVIKLDSRGEVIWTDTIDEGDGDSIIAVAETEDGGYVVSGGVSDDGDDFSETRRGIIVKYNSEGEREWVREQEEDTYGFFNSIVPTEDGGILVLGQREINSNLEGFIAKYSSEGAEVWIKSINGNLSDWFSHLVKCADGGYVISGYSDSTNLVPNANNSLGVNGFLMKFDSEWNREWGVSYNEQLQSNFRTVVECVDGGFIAFGGAEGFSSLIAVKYSKDGVKEWVLPLDGMIEGFDVEQMERGVFLVTGVSETVQNIYLLVDEEGGLRVFEDISLDSQSVSTTLVRDIDGGFVGGVLSLLDAKSSIVKFSPKKDADIQISGSVETMIADVTIPSVSPDLVINPNLPEGFVAPEFFISNDSVSPIKLDLKTFEQTTDTFNDVLPSKYASWVGLNKTQSQDIALGLVAKEGEGWQTLTTPTSYVANHMEHEIGVIKPASTVDFAFDVKHGTSFSEAKTVQYKMVFVFDLLN